MYRTQEKKIGFYCSLLLWFLCSAGHWCERWVKPISSYEGAQDCSTLKNPEEERKQLAPWATSAWWCCVTSCTRVSWQVPLPARSWGHVVSQMENPQLPRLLPHTAAPHAIGRWSTWSVICWPAGGIRAARCCSAVVEIQDVWEKGREGRGKGRNGKTTNIYFPSLTCSM